MQLGSGSGVALTLARVRPATQKLAEGEGPPREGLWLWGFRAVLQTALMSKGQGEGRMDFAKCVTIMIRLD